MLLGTRLRLIRYGAQNQQKTSVFTRICVPEAQGFRVPMASFLSLSYVLASILWLFPSKCLAQDTASNPQFHQYVIIPCVLQCFLSALGGYVLLTKCLAQDTERDPQFHQYVIIPCILQCFTSALGGYVLLGTPPSGYVLLGTGGYGLLGRLRLLGTLE